MPDKHTIRKQILEKRAALLPHTLDKSGIMAAEKLILMEEYKNANTVMLYMDFRNEVPTGKIIDQVRTSGKRLILPLTDKSFDIIAYEIPNGGTLSEYLTISSYGISEPNPLVCPKADLKIIDLVVVPGSVFDQYENRLGYGKGCYDKFLPHLSKNAFKLGLAYDFQVLPCIPSSPTDVKMDKILTIGTI